MLSPPSFLSFSSVCIYPFYNPEINKTYFLNKDQSWSFSLLNCCCGLERLSKATGKSKPMDCWTHLWWGYLTHVYYLYSKNFKRPSLLKWLRSLLLYYPLTVVLRYNSHTLPFSYLLCTIQSFLVYSQTCTAIAAIDFRTFCTLW